MTNEELKEYEECGRVMTQQRQRIAELETELAEALKWKDKWETCEKWRKFYQEAKGKLYAMGGEVAKACCDNMPCNESQVDQWFRAEFVSKAAYDRLLSELAEARKDGERLSEVRAIIQCDRGRADGCNPQVLLSAVASAIGGTR